MTSSVLSLASVLFVAGSAHGSPWAVLVTGSHTYDNYRHHADVAHAYHRLVAGGINKSQILSMQYNDVASDEQNPYPGKLYNKASGSFPGVDVNSGFVQTYTGGNVTRDNFLAMLLCNATIGTKGKPCLESTAEDDVFIYWAGHGSVGTLLLPDMSAANALYADELISALTTLKQKKRFKRMVIYVEACESGSMFAGTLDASLGVYAVTAASPSQDSYPIYCCVYNRPPSCTVHGQDIGSCLGDMFSVAWLDDADQQSQKETLAQNFLKAKRKTAAVRGNPGSTVKQYGDTSWTDVPIDTFIGPVSLGAGRNTTGPSAFSAGASTAAVASTAAAVQAAVSDAAPSPGRGSQGNEHLVKIAAHAGAPWPPRDDLTPTLADFACYRELITRIERMCPPSVMRGTSKPGGPLSHGPFRFALQSCIEGNAAEVAAAVGTVCSAHAA